MPIPLETLQREHIIPRVLAATTTVAELLYLFKEQPPAHPAFAVVRVGADAYDVLTLADLGEAVMQRGAALLPMMLRAVPGLLQPAAPVWYERTDRDTAERQRSQAPRRRLVVLDATGAVLGGLGTAHPASKSPVNPLALLSAAPDPASSTLSGAARPSPIPPHLNTRFDGVAPNAPLTVGRRVPLIVSVGPPTATNLGRSDLFTFDFAQATGPVAFTIHVDADPEMWIVRAVEPILIVNPFTTFGYTQQEAEFLVTAKHPGRDKLHISVERADTGATIQHVWLPVVAAHAQAAETLVPAAIEHTVVSLPLDSPAGERRRVEITIQPGEESFRAIVRADLPGQCIRETYRVPVSGAEIQNATLRLRQELKNIVFYTTTVNGQTVYPFASRTNLTADETLARSVAVPLADAGEQVWRLLFNAPRAPAELKHLAAGLRDLPHGSTVQIVLDSRQFIVPWALLYDRPGSISAETLDWSGFWGYRYILDTLPPGNYPAPLITDAPAGLLLLLNDDSNLRQFTDAQVDFVQSSLVNARPAIAWGHASVQQMLVQPSDAVLVYCYCHGDHKSGAITVGNLASESAISFSGQQHLRLADLRRLPAAAFPGRPLVFLNACEGATQDAFYYDGFMPFFIEELGARGFIGTEVQAPQLLAHDYAVQFLRMFAEGIPVGEILWRLRRHYLDTHHTILGFNYSLYCLGDVRLATAARTQE